MILMDERHDLIDRLRVTKISRNTAGLDSFKNEEGHMVKHLKRDALNDQNNGISCTHVWSDGGTIVGFVSTSMFSIMKAKTGLDVRFQEIPVLLLGKIARHTDYKGKGVGPHMLTWVDGFAKKLSKETGCRGIALHAQNIHLVKFYNKHGYDLIDEDDLIMFRDLYGTYGR